MSGDIFELCKRYPAHFKIVGNVHLNVCPVCSGGEFSTIWQLPQTRLENKTFLSSPGAPYHNSYISFLPMLSTPQQIFVFDLCHRCEAIFLNPKIDDQQAYINDTSKVRAFREKGLDPWRGAAVNYMKYAPEKTGTIVDAACGSGQILGVLRETRPDLKLTGLELSRPSVAFMRDDLHLDSHVADLDCDDLESIVPSGSADYVIFNESYEHVRTPTVVLEKLLRMLRPGGRLRFSAQAYGPEFSLQIRVGEPIFISTKTLAWTVARTGTKMINLETSAKMYIVLEKQ